MGYLKAACGDPLIFLPFCSIEMEDDTLQCPRTSTDVTKPYIMTPTGSP